MIILHAIGGMCNRLRAILGFRALHGPIQVVWAKDATVAYSHFLQVFKPLPGVEFVDVGEGPAAFNAPPNAPEDWWRGLSDLVPIFAPTPWREGDYDAVHIRRTDHWPVANEFAGQTTDPDFIAWLDSRKGPFWIATDNQQTQRRFLERFHPRGFGLTFTSHGDERRGEFDRTRDTSLAAAVKDLFMCVGARDFKGSNASTFSQTIDHLRAF